MSVPVPTRAEVRAAIPEGCREPRTSRSLLSLAGSLAATAVPVALAAAFLPLTWAWAPVWVLYAVVCGTAATGLWVLAHECGHGAFSSSRPLRDTVGFVLHSALLVPYFSWQRSHAVHHAFTNHLDDGETHVPGRASGGPTGPRGPFATTLVIARSLLLGWPAYLLAGATGGPSRGRTNHFWPVAPFESDLFPPRWRARVWGSGGGVLVVLVALVAWAVAVGSVVPVLALYVGPYLVVNAWLVTYTWLQHTDTDVPHLADPEWDWVLGAFQTVDRPYPAVVDVLHHHIGTTHVAHHLDPRIPHYRAREATDAIATAFPELYRFDPTPVGAALWRVAGRCRAVDRHDEAWWFVPPLDEPERTAGDADELDDLAA
ncbi:MAG: fatty acid desaturase [Microthrixaceae bacterium]